MIYLCNLLGNEGGIGPEQLLRHHSSVKHVGYQTQTTALIPLLGETRAVSYMNNRSNTTCCNYVLTLITI